MPTQEYLKCINSSQQCYFTTIDTRFKFCPICGNSLATITNYYNNIADNYKNTYGTWRVGTEGDCEGKTVKDLGTYLGHIDEIALYLANKCYYSLIFQYVPQQFHEEISNSQLYFGMIDYTTKSKEADVILCSESRTWDMKEDFIPTIKELFKDRSNIIIEKGNYFLSFKIKLKED